MREPTLSVVPTMTSSRAPWASKYRPTGAEPPNVTVSMTEAIHLM